MPITKSAKKALRQSEKKRQRNLLKKKNLKQAIKRFKTFVAEKKLEQAEKELSLVYKYADKAAKTGQPFKKNKAFRIKSRMAKRMKNAH